jgi:hypothetical protein
MSRQLETTLTEAVTKNLSAATTFLLGGDSLRKANKNPDPPAE